MVLDNFDDQKVSFKPERRIRGGDSDLQFSHVPLRQYLPQGLHGSILITSRDRGTAFSLTTKESDIINILPMSIEDAEALLDKKIPDDSSTKVERRHLIELLDFVPLAITQAAAYIERQRSLGMSVATYSKELQYDGGIVLEDFPDLRRDLEVPSSVVKTWYKSFHQIEQDSPLAAELFSLMCMFDRNGIPKFLLDGQFDNDRSFRSILTPLVDYSLVIVELGCPTFIIHRLVHFAMTAWLESRHLVDRHRKNALDLLENCLSKQEAELGVLQAQADYWQGYWDTTGSNIRGEWSIWTRQSILLPHVQLMCEIVFTEKEQLLQQASICSITALYCQQRYKWSEAETFISKALKTQLEILGENDITTLLSARLAGTLAAENGRPADAEIILRRALSKLEELPSGVGAMISLKPVEYKTIQDSMHNDLTFITNSMRLTLAETLLGQRKIDEAISILQPLKSKLELTCGKIQPDTLLIIEVLGHARMLKHDYEEARRLFKETVAGSVALRGEMHFETLQSHLRLPELDWLTGSYQEAERLQRDLTEKMCKILPVKHPEVLKCTINLAIIVHCQERLEEAEELY